ncbi:EamA family transporter RarD [Falsihalocynthiibacter arcticus]|uniref:RarD protein n=1 Tax=Falsihalocynthiibacter arcticus TaxID=1579316 RepID=A0A126V1W1_9RHOB|nr:EamA family transporter RarD [Falsihalocynthiibacter arcticus]AML52312.1 RarD protein [Falsihalocynthiibacter arcticus]
MPEHIKGSLAMLLACVVWGFSSIYYKAIDHVAPLEVLSHRSLWSLAFLLGILAVQGRLPTLWPILRDHRKMLWITAASLLISINWFLFIYAVQSGRAVESSLGYFIFPLFAVLLGAFVLGERLGPLKWAAVALAAMAVMGLTYALEAPPWISLVLSSTFAVYGLIKKQLDAGPVVSVTLEVLILLPLGVIWLWGAHTQGWQAIGTQTPGVFGKNWQDSLLLIFSGVLTAVPLLLLSYASKRVSLATLGLLTYVNPTLQFLVAVFLFGEIMTPAHLIAFPVIWIALALYSVVSFSEERSSRKALRNAATVSTT